MFRLNDHVELLNCFRDLDREEVILREDLKFPLVVVDYLSWLEPSGARAYLVFKSDDFKAPLGVVFRRDQTMGPSLAAMCDWCHSVRTGNEVGLLTTRSQKRKKVGISLCRDLSCAAKIRGTHTSSVGVHDFPSTRSTQERIRVLLEKMTHFARAELI